MREYTWPLMTYLKLNSLTTKLGPRNEWTVDTIIIRTRNSFWHDAIFVTIPVWTSGRECGHRKHDNCTVNQPIVINFIFSELFITIALAVLKWVLYGHLFLFFLFLSFFVAALLTYKWKNISQIQTKYK